MAVAPQLSPFELVDLRQLRARELAPLLEEERRLWAEELHWDHRPSAEMIRKHVEARTLPGVAALIHGRVAGYSFHILDDTKGIIGELYVLREFRRQRPAGTPAGVATLLLEHTLAALEGSPTLRRLEAQIIPCGTEPLAPVFLAHDFRSFPRVFLYKELRPSAPRAASLPEKVVLRPWEDSYFQPMAALIVDAYRGHVDSRINDQYSTSAGSLRFLKNIVIFPGCGVFLAETSLVAVEEGTERLLGAALTSRVAAGVAHVTQVCVAPARQGQGLGRALMEAVLARLGAGGYRGVSLTVTAENKPAIELYYKLGFRVIKGFAAFARDLG